jgi:2-polyprenyl-6-methoxyphenol hydroxylase-like FAD-dependent oxidoreductase
LNIRGQTALKHFDRPGRSVGLWAAVRSAGVECDSFFLHLGQRAVQIRKSTAASDPEAPPPTILLPRNKLCDAMKTNLLGLHGGPNLDIEYGCRLERLDIDKKVAYFGGKEYSYDLVIGADGVQSPVRKSLFGMYVLFG